MTIERLRGLMGRLTGNYSRLAVLSSVAVMTAYLVADAIPHAEPTIAAITALVSVRPTLHESAGEMMRQVVGTLMGAVIGVVMMLQFGFSPLLMLLLTLSGFVVAKILRLGEGGAVALGITVILVMLQLDKLSAVEDRVIGVAVGAGVGVVFSLWVRPGMPHHRALTESLTQADHSADLLLEISSHLSENRGAVSPEVAEDWRERAEENMRAIARTRLDAEAALASAKWSPLVDRRDAEAVVEQVRLAAVTARTVYTMASHLRVAALTGSQVLTGEMAANVAGVLAATANVIVDQAQLAQENPAETLDDRDTGVQSLATSQEAVLQDIREADDTQELLLAGALLRDVAAIADGLIAEAPEGPTEERTAETERPSV